MNNINVVKGLFFFCLVSNWNMRAGNEAASRSSREFEGTHLALLSS